MMLSSETSLPEKMEADYDHYAQGSDGGCETDSGLGAWTDSARSGADCGGGGWRNGCWEGRGAG